MNSFFLFSHRKIQLYFVLNFIIVCFLNILQHVDEADE
jgi:hypothetical protein